MKVLGLDIGGANIKVSDADGNTRSVVFPMWTRNAELRATLAALIPDDASSPDMIALTMTAELADCFQTKSEGVNFIIDAVQQAFSGIPIRIWLTSGEFAEPDDARDLWMLVAAANWHAQATWAGRAMPEGPAVLFDMGSTTTDIIPLLDGQPVPAGRNDIQRLESGDLIYSGAYRTPICAIVSSVPLHGARCPVAAEAFATIADALVILDQLEEDSARTDTADGRPLTKNDCRHRLARMVCCDGTELSEQDLSAIASCVVEEQQNRILDSFSRVTARLAAVMEASGQRSLNDEAGVLLLSGSGAEVGKRILAAGDVTPFGEILDVRRMFHQSVSDAACAFAVARLAHDRCRDDLLETSEPTIFGA